MKKPLIQIIAMPKDTNEHGFIFGGWILANMDIAGAIAAREIYTNKVVTVGANNIFFREKILVGDVVKICAKAVKLGTTSVLTKIEVHVSRFENNTLCNHFVCSGEMTYVYVHTNGEKAIIPEEIKKNFTSKI